MKLKQSPFPHVTFTVDREYLDEHGLWNPRNTDRPLEAGFQVNMFGSREHYLRLADAIRAFAEQDTSNDGDYHMHFEDLRSVNRKVRLHVILRKDDVGDSMWKAFFPTRR